MALTATATRQSRRSICQILGMEKVIVVSEAPDRPNIEYTVQTETESIEIVFALLVEELRTKRTAMDRVIVFCRSYDNASHLYAYFRSRLGSEGLEPVTAPDLSKYRMFDLFTACSPKNVKESIILFFFYTK